jgi:Putative MetA-pathway of phenol degradation
MNRLLLLLFLLASRVVFSQTLDDGLMMPKKDFCAGILFTHSQWNNYWEGVLKRDNQNIGTLSTTHVMWLGNYGVTDKLNAIAMVPYIATKASQGTMAGMQGVQDLTIGGKYLLVKKEVGANTFSVFGVGVFSTPLTNYTPDFLPLSIGLHSTTVSGRAVINYATKGGWYANFSPAYVYRGNVLLDRYTYFTDGVQYNTNEVRMFDQFNYNFSIGYNKNGLQAEINFYQQNTLGGGDIRRQDVPFVSNRMNFSNIGAVVMYYLPKPKNVAVRLASAYTIDGRNVGQTFSITGGLLYTIHFSKK